jgi:hypothetical protein
MHAALLLLPLLTLLAVPQVQKGKTPKSGDSIVVTGCLRSAMLEATEMGFASEEEHQRLPAAHTFQLKGKKDLLKDLREKFDGHVVTVTGVLKSRLTESSGLGTQVGNTRIVVGGETSTRSVGGGMSGGAEALPVLEAKSFEGSPTTCRR